MIGPSKLFSLVWMQTSLKILLCKPFSNLTSRKCLNVFPSHCLAVHLDSTALFVSFDPNYVLLSILRVVMEATLTWVEDHLLLQHSLWGQSSKNLKITVAVLYLYQLSGIVIHQSTKFWFMSLWSFIPSTLPCACHSEPIKTVTWVLKYFCLVIND